MCTNDDLKELDVAMGPRKKLMSYIVEQKERKRIAEVYCIILSPILNRVKLSITASS